MRALALVLLLVGPAAFAQKSEEEAGDTSEVDKDALSPLRDRVAPVSGHVFLMKGRFEASPQVGFTFRDAFFSKYVFGLMLSYHFTEELGVRLRGGYALNTSSGAAQICETNAQGVRTCRVPDVPELTAKGGYGHVNLLADLDLEWAPIYGKLALIAEAFLHFNMYINLGPTLVLYTNQGAGAGTQPGMNATVGGNIGIGMRFFVTKFMTFRVELRDVLYGEYSQQSSTTAFRNQLMVDLGISFFFPTTFDPG